jgi:hypothetical protein
VQGRKMPKQGRPIFARKQIRRKPLAQPEVLDQE